MMQWGKLIATAFHEPDKLNDLFKPSVSETARRAHHDPGAWDQDQWWTSQR